jgi:cell fate regulator YaaT (PSP1 superfamily)
MPTIVGVKLRNAPKQVLLDTKGLELAEDGIVVVIGERGPELGKIVTAPRETEDGENAESQVRIERSATPEDLKSAEDLHRREKEAMPVYRRLVAKHALEMKPIDVEFPFDGARGLPGPRAGPRLGVPRAHRHASDRRA